MIDKAPTIPIGSSQKLVCVRCGYDLTKPSGPICPECGQRTETRVEPHMRSKVDAIVMGYLGALQHLVIVIVAFTWLFTGPIGVALATPALFVSISGLMGTVGGVICGVPRLAGVATVCQFAIMLGYTAGAISAAFLSSPDWCLGLLLYAALNLIPAKVFAHHRAMLLRLEAGAPAYD